MSKERERALETRLANALERVVELEQERDAADSALADAFLEFEQERAAANCALATAVRKYELLIEQTSFHAGVTAAYVPLDQIPALRARIAALRKDAAE